MTRAVIELSGDISPAMPHMSRHIEGCAYSPETSIMGFRFKDMGVIVEARKITVNLVDDEAAAREVVDWLKNIMNTTDEAVAKQEVS